VRHETPGFEVEAQGQITLGMLLGDITGEILGEDEAVAHPQPARAFGKSPPRPAAEIAIERDLDRRRAAVPDEPRRDHLGVVEDEEVARPQQSREIRDPPVLQGNSGSVGTPLTQLRVSLGAASPTLLNPLPPRPIDWGEREG
jgi:hypothetical protein